MKQRTSIAVVGGGWAGLAAAVEATRAGHQVTLFEAARSLGGRARSLEVALPGSGASFMLDNGQHILIGAYAQTLSLMQAVGVEPAQVLHATPLRLQAPDGGGLSLPPWPAPLDLAWGVASARGWGWRDKASLLAAALRWRRAGFRCPPGLSVQALGSELSPRVNQDLIEPLCVSALNTPVAQASAEVFLRVLRDALLGPGWGPWRGSWLLLPRAPLGELLPQAAGDWLRHQGARVITGRRIDRLHPCETGWQVDGESFDAVVLACPSGDALRLLQPVPQACADWLERARSLCHAAIATVYVTGGPALPQPLLALRSGPRAPAQFVVDRGQLGGPAGLLAFVVSASEGTRDEIAHQVLAQARQIGWHGLRVLKTVVDKRATFACTPGLQRPGIRVADGLWACGDYVQGPYPATLEGAVRSANEVVAGITRQVAPLTPSQPAAAHTAR